jgi:hypothetical protein
MLTYVSMTYVVQVAAKCRLPVGHNHAILNTVLVYFCASTDSTNSSHSLFSVYPGICIDALLYQ